MRLRDKRESTYEAFRVEKKVEEHCAISYKRGRRTRRPSVDISGSCIETI